MPCGHYHRQNNNIRQKSINKALNQGSAIFHDRLSHPEFTHNSSAVVQFFKLSHDSVTVASDL